MRGIIDADLFCHWAAYGSDTPEESAEMTAELIIETMEASFADEFLVAVKGKGNFRKEVGNYKANRKELDEDTKAKLVAGHKVLVNDFGAVMAHGMEADDQCRMWAEEAKAEGVPYVIIGEDKDLRCIAGPHFNPKKKQHFYVEEDEADMFFHAQLLAGDSTDGIPGLWRVGLKTAMNKFLKDVPMGERMGRVLEVWEEKQPDTWEEKLRETGIHIHILRSADDSFDKVMEEYYASTVPV